MPFQGVPWTEFISCPVCVKVFNEKQQRPISLGCGHTVCKSCLRNRLNDNRCPFDQSVLPTDVDKLPANFALMHLVGAAVPEQEKEATKTVSDNPRSYEQARKCIEEMAVHLKPLAENLSDDDSSTCSDTPSKENSSNNKNSSSVTSKCVLSRPMQRKLISLIHCQLLEEEGRSRAARIARSLGERIVSELLVSHQYPHQLSANLWAAVRTRGCQFLGPAMQEEVLKLILLALEDGSFLSRKVLVLFVVQRLEARYPQASKTAIGHVVQLLYRASCFKVLKRDEESSLMQLKDAFRQYESLRREHDSQIVQIAIEAGLRISPEQWSSLLYGDPAHKSHMQSIIDKHQSPQSFSQSIIELMLTLQRGSDPNGLQKLQPQLEFLSNIDPSPDCPAPSWENLEAVMRSLNTIMTVFVKFLGNPDHRSRLEVAPIQNTRYKTSMCRDFTARGTCPRGNTCTFAHSQEELERYRSRSRRSGNRGAIARGPEKTSSALSASESDQLKQVQQISKLKIQAVAQHGVPVTSHSVAELLDLKNTPSSPFAPGLHKQTLNQIEPPRTLPNQIFNQQPQTQALDPEKPPFVPPGPQNMSNTHLTFSRPAVDAPQVPNHPGMGHQPYFHPQTGPFPPSQAPYQHDIVMQGPPSFQVPFNSQGLRMPQFPMQPMNVAPPMRLPHPQIPGGPAMLGPNPIGGIQGPFGPRPQFAPSSSPGELSMAPVTTPSATVEVPDMGNKDVPCVPVNQMGGVDPSVCQSPQMMPYPVQGDSLKDLALRKKQIISNIREEPVFMSPKSSICHADSPRASVDGLKTVLGNNKRTQKPMPKLVSDMFVATRSTQSLDELKNDDPFLFDVEWSDADDHQGNTYGAIAASSIVSLVTSVNNSASFNASNSCPETEFCCFPDDGSDECFIPFEVTSVSKFGPISRMSRVKTNNCAPVQVTADVACKRMTPVLAVTPLERPLPSAMPVPSRYSSSPRMEPPVKPTPSESPSVWKQTPQPSYQNIAMLKTGAAEALTNSEKLAYELQAVELEISMKTGREPQPVGKMIQDAVMGQQQPAQGGNFPRGEPGVPNNGNNVMALMGRGHVTDCLTSIEAGGSLVSPQRAAQRFMDDYHRSWQGVKK